MAGCKEKRTPRVIDRSFYYWKSAFNPDSSELKALRDFHVNRLYVKFFDVAWNELKSEPMPVAVLEFRQKQSSQSYQIIPTVFITNDCMTKIEESRIPELASRILLLIKKISGGSEPTTPPEIQLDCDWTDSTKDKYFLLLQTIKILTASNKMLLSVTIRLYQYKYFKKAGIPPADRGLLMCYNMGNLKNPDTRNSILESRELEKYLNGPATYPLPLDVALPIFSWKVLFRNQKYNGLINQLSTGLLKNNSSITQSGNIFRVLEKVSINGYNFEPGDMIRDEEITYDELIKAERLLDQTIKTKRLSIILYHLDSITLSKFSTHELETLFDFLH